MPRHPLRVGSSGRLLALAVGFVGCGGGAFARSVAGTSPAPAPDVFTCMRDQLKAVGFTQTSYDTDDLRLTARKFDETQRRPNVLFRRLVDRLEIDVDPGAGEAVTTISIEAKTFAELSTHRGPTEEQERTSEAARTAAQTLLQKCSEPVDSASVPG